MKKITQKEIAAKLGLYVRTVAGVLNHEDTVKPENRMEVCYALLKSIRSGSKPPSDPYR